MKYNKASDLSNPNWLYHILQVCIGWVNPGVSRPALLSGYARGNSAN